MNSANMFRNMFIASVYRCIALRISRVGRSKCLQQGHVLLDYAPLEVTSGSVLLG